ncbi:hypothetical protein D3C76_1359810 [compost metagenome]
MKTVSTESFLLDVDGNIDAETISTSEFKSKVSEYSKSLNNRYDVVTLYIKNDNVYCVYKQSEILNLLGMGTHMGLGLIIEPQSIILN